MTRREASLILGISPTASKTKVKVQSLQVYISIYAMAEYGSICSMLLMAFLKSVQVC
jgi:hypothetical protein